MKILLLVTLCRIAFCLCVVRYITSVKTNAMVLPTDRCLFSSNLVDFWWKYSEYRCSWSYFGWSVVDTGIS
jgi:hypothetical protein